MRVISQIQDIDIEYEGSNFNIEDDGSDFVVKAYNNGMFFEMGRYSSNEAARNALIGMSNMNSRCLLYTGINTAMVEHDTFDNLIVDKKFENIEIKPLNNLVYFFPED